jgi:hypothetical protein
MDAISGSTSIEDVVKLLNEMGVVYGIQSSGILMVKPHSQLKLIGLRGLFRHSSGAPDCQYSDRFLEPA